MKYKSFILDPFQVEAYNALMKGKSVVVSAATGTGKTLIADFVINHCIGEFLQDIKSVNSHLVTHGPRVVYTAPIKALSNQKYREFTSEYGNDLVGILTGDVQINPTAPMVIMTTEIYRNMLISQDNLLKNLQYTIFDEVHYLSDFERGTIWEEAIIFSPDHVKFLCLSATIPNAIDFAQWIKSIKGHDIEVISWEERSVPLKLLLYDSELGICNFKSLRKALIEEQKAQLITLDKKTLRKLKKKKSRYWHKIMKQQRKKQPSIPPPNHKQLVLDLKKKDMLPALIFSFSRKDCQKKARDLSGNLDFSTPACRSLAQDLFKELVDQELHDLYSVKLVQAAVNRGIGVHHAGLLPGLKLMVEKMFNLGHIKVLYATETFALGVNMPARTVAYLNIRKFDGFRNRFLYSNEFFQCAGRAGRRGIDEIGYVITMIGRNRNDLNEYRNMSTSALEEIISQFTLTYNTVINLVKNHTPEERERILKSSFDYYIRRKERKHMWVMRRYKQYLRILNNLKYLDGEKVTNKGEFASKIYAHELLVTEIFETGLYKKLDLIALAILISTIMYEERRDDHFKFDRETNYYEKINLVISRNPLVANEINHINLKRMCLIVRYWCQGLNFTELLDVTNLEEGDVVHMFRNTIDLARQIRHATDNPDIIEKMEKIIDMFDRDVVKVSF